jgi:hypothetical protein
MGWNQAMQYLRANMSREPERVDAGLPLGARIGSLVSLQQSPLIRAAADGSLITTPDASEIRILAVSQLQLRQSGGLFRYYLATGDDGADEKFLQVYRSPQGEVTEVLYCTQLARVIPETAEDQDAFMGSQGYGLGDRSYTLWRSQVEGLLDNADLDNVFGHDHGLDYWRDAGDPQTEFIPPFEGSEVRLDDAQGKQGLRQSLYYMPYVRALRGGGQEYLLISTELVHSVNGDASKRSIHVDFVVGIQLDLERIAIQ